MGSSVNLSLTPVPTQFLSSCSTSQPRLLCLKNISNPHFFNLNPTLSLLSLQASRRSTNNYTQKGDDFASDRRDWKQNLDFYGDDDEDEDEEEEEDEEEDRSLDLLIMFVQNVFKKISRKARKAIRSVLPVNISTKLVGFSVNGIIILAFLWILKAFLEVICTLGTVVFVSILLVRCVWTGISYLQDTRRQRTDEFDDVWNNTQPAN
ncbi:protein SHORT HYPOCOTYL IN WHITE LIGHT 1 [Heracleum sosnowskyi]|uniref:Protein SHORT HYPOCOTYL IN WHITE LIGHT 1 n=1 Tax=Heracleum sosnowskyi TaxID=360622 RepID=A0AAD8H2Q1_9APIA|nr:protein SHORT HYPOCOTYL IN WHITE LIGHT 1 [Heracleum sosnowskyi]